MHEINVVVNSVFDKNRYNFRTKLVELHRMTHGDKREKSMFFTVPSIF